ncbi:MAG TPA: extracellular solute-binding protein, partial [Beijerinckiaceae bacterium]|nr:extracellular solute-binding protein [Beijerinckiaceae bacterium]
GAAAQALIDAAKKEGSVTWYTAQIINQLVRPISDAFEKKYGIKVNAVRADASDNALRIAAEGQAGKMQADVFDGTTTSPSLERLGLVLKWQPDGAKRLPPQFVDKNGYWVANNLYVQNPCFNTSLVPPGTEPKTWDDLLDPKWRGRMVISGTSSASAGAGFVGVVLTEMGEQKGMDYLRKLAQQNVAIMDVAARAITDQVISGEYAVGLQVFNHQSVISARKGAPVDWIPWNPSLAVLSVAGVTKGAPHENAGKLLLDFLISPEGQKIFSDNDYIPVDPDVPAKSANLNPEIGHFRAIYLTPEELEPDIAKWLPIFQSLFR